MHTTTLLWVDLRNQATGSSSLVAAFSRQYSVQMMPRHAFSLEQLIDHAADLICFEYDYPDISSLNLLQETRKANSDCPILMFTEQHSEALAVWAFRTGVWDYHVTPLSEVDLHAIAGSIENARSFRGAIRAQASDAKRIKLPDEVRFRAPPSDQQTLQPAISHVELHYSEKIPETAMAALCGMSCSKFSRLFKQAFDVTFQEYVLRYRLGESARLLLNPVASIADVAFTVGFNDPSYYARAFKKSMGVSPSQFRQLLQDNKHLRGVSPERMQQELMEQALTA